MEKRKKQYFNEINIMRGTPGFILQEVLRENIFIKK